MMGHFFLAGLLALSLGASSTMYVQPTELNLQQEPRRSATLVALVIGTECKLLEKVDAYWLRVSCQGHEGYVPAASLGPGKPRVEKLLAEAKRPGLEPRERLERAARAAALAPGRSVARTALRRYYLEFQFERLASGRGEEPPAERRLECASPSRPSDCLVKALFPQRLFTSCMIERRKNDFVAVGTRSGQQLYVVRGSLRTSPSKDSGGVSFVIGSHDFEDLDARLIAEALGLKPAGAPASQPRYASDGEGNYSRRKTGSRLQAIDGENRQVLIDLEKHIPSGEGGEIRMDLRGNLLLDVLFVGDFEQDGRDDALLEVSTGGNCCAPCYLFASLPAEDNPVVTRTFCTWDGPPLIGEAEGRVSFTITDEVGEKVYALDNGEARLLSDRAYPKLETVFEYTSEQLWKLAEARDEGPDLTTETLKYDLDEDGREELIECKGWERWNGLRCRVYREDRKLIGTFGGCKRIGVLPGKTHGMRDMICDEHHVSKWNGTTYP